MVEPTWTTVAAAKQHPAIGDQHPNDAVARVLAAVESRIEEFTGVAWVPRDVAEHAIGSGNRTVWLSQTRCTELTAVEVAGEAQDLTGWRLDWHGRLNAPTRIPAGAPVTVTYTHGEAAPPHDLLDAALRATGTLLGHGRNPRIGERTETLVGEGATINFAAIPDAGRGRPFGMPDIDTVVMGYADERPVLA